MNSCWRSRALRAVEHDRYVVVAGTTGISAVIAPDGQEVARTEFFTPAYLDVAVRLKTSETPATRWGPLVQWVLVGAAIAVVVAVILHNGWFVRLFRRRKRERDAGGTSGGGDESNNPPEWANPPQPWLDSTTKGVMTDRGKTGAELPSQRTLVIIPTFNELENLPLIVGRVHKCRPDVHVLIVDDGSPDGTGELADELSLADPDRVHVMHRDAKDGLGAAYLEGFAWGLGRQYNVLVEMDADGSHAPEQLYRLLDAIDNGADLAIGSRYVHGGTVRNWPYRRLVLSQTGQHLFAGLARRRHPRHHRRLPRLSPRSPGEDRPVGRRFQGLLLPDRPDLAHHQQRVHRHRGAHHIPRARTRGVENERLEHPRSDGQGCPMGHRRARGPRRGVVR